MIIAQGSLILSTVTIASGQTESGAISTERFILMWDFSFQRHLPGLL